MKLSTRETRRARDAIDLARRYRQTFPVILRSAEFVAPGGRMALVLPAEQLDELFAQRNRLVHSPPDLDRLNRDPESPPEPHEDLRNVARWLSATSEAVVRLSKASGDFHTFHRVAEPLLNLATLDSFEPDRHGRELENAVRRINRDLTREDNEGIYPYDEKGIEVLLKELDPDWDLSED